jgi:hypothetical protein
MVKIFYVAGLIRSGQTLLYNVLSTSFSKTLRRDNSNFSLESGAYPFYVNNRQTQNKKFNYNLKEYDAIILSCQDFVFNKENINELIQKTKKYPEITEIYFIQIIRNPLNHLASIRKFREKHIHKLIPYPALISENFNNMEKFKFDKRNDMNFFYLNYDKLISNNDYKMKFFKFCNFNVPYIKYQKSFDKVYGSSFSGYSIDVLKLKKEPIKTTFSERYKHFLQDKIYLEYLVKIPNLIHIIETYFEINKKDLDYFRKICN